MLAGAAAALSKHLERLRPWNTHWFQPRTPAAAPGGQCQDFMGPSSVTSGHSRATGSPPQGQREAGTVSLSWPQSLAGSPCTATGSSNMNQQEALPVSGILTIPAPNSSHPVLFLLLKSEVLQLLLLSDAHQLLSSPCLSNSRH